MPVRGAAAQQGAPAAGADDAGASELAAPDSLPPLARVLLRGRMHRHRDDMGALLRAVLLLQRPRVAELASQLADEPSLARPGDGSDTLNAALPPHFFQLEAQLHEQAGELAEAAQGRADEAVLAQRFGQLMETCVRCHQAYQRPAEAQPR